MSKEVDNGSQKFTREVSVESGNTVVLTTIETQKEVFLNTEEALEKKNSEVILRTLAEVGKGATIAAIIGGLGMLAGGAITENESFIISGFAAEFVGFAGRACLGSIEGPKRAKEQIEKIKSIVPKKDK